MESCSAGKLAQNDQKHGCVPNMKGPLQPGRKFWEMRGKMVICRADLLDSENVSIHIVETFDGDRVVTPLKFHVNDLFQLALKVLREYNA